MGRKLSRPPIFTRLHRKGYTRYTFTNSHSTGIVKKRLQSDASLYTILQILSLTLFEKTPLIQLLTEDPLASEQIAMANQLNLFEF